METVTLEHKIQLLSPQQQSEVETIIEQMLSQQTSEAPREWKFDWEGVLKDMKTEFTSVELQHAITTMWRQRVSR
jgi:hypothetical protein